MIYLHMFRMVGPTGHGLRRPPAQVTSGLKAAVTVDAQSNDFTRYQWNCR